MNPLENIQVVLVRTAMAANLGAVARAMHNFGLSRLALVQPEADSLSLEARATATHGEPILDQAQRFDSLAEAVVASVLVVATSARLGGLFRSHSAATLRDFAPKLIQAARGQTVSLVFGPESTGLLTEEVSQCQQLVTIPAAPANPVLNLGQAVVVCLYELFLAAGAENTAPPPAEEVASFAEQQRAYQHLEEALTAVHFLWNSKASAQMHALRHWLSRAGPSRMELDLLHGVARQILWWDKHGKQRSTADESPPGPAS